MSGRTCPVCTKPMTDTAGICLTCTNDLADSLRRVPALLADLNVMLARQDRITSANRLGPDTDPVSMPYSVAASNAVTRLRRTLLHWCDTVQSSSQSLSTHKTPHGDVVVVEQGLPLLSRTDPVSCASWLAHRLRWLRRLPEAKEAHRAIVGEIDRATRVIDRAADLAYGGPCGAHLGDGAVCTETLWARRGAGTVQCPRCKAMWDFQARRTNALKAAEDRLESPETIARALTTMGMPLTVARIYQWRHRGQLIPAREDNGRTRYRLGDVMDLWSRMERQG